MIQKFKSIASVFIFLCVFAAGAVSAYAAEGMMAPMPREKTSMDNTLAWTVPAGWQEKTASGMRLATFASSDATQAIDVSIVLLGPAAGALEPNLERWAGQIDVSTDAQAMKQLMDSAASVKTKLDREVKVYDFSVLQNGQGASTKSMITSVISLDSATVFVKMTGTLETLAKNKGPFKELVASLHKK